LAIGKPGILCVIADEDAVVWPLWVTVFINALKVNIVVAGVVRKPSDVSKSIGANRNFWYDLFARKIGVTCVFGSV